MPFISENDEADLKFGCENDIDMVAASFTRRPEDVKSIKAILKKYGSRGILAAFFYCINVTDSEPLEIRKNNASC